MKDGRTFSQTFLFWNSSQSEHRKHMTTVKNPGEINLVVLSPLDTTASETQTIQRRIRGRPRTFSIDAAIDRGINLFWTFGYEATSIGMICKALNITAPSFYAAFGSKDEFFRAVLNAYELKYWSDASSLFLETTDIKKAIRDYFLWAANIMGNKTKCRGCLIAQTASSSIEAVRSYAQTKRRKLKELFSKRITEAIACGAIHPVTDSNACALGLTALLSGMAIDARNGEPVETLEHYAQAALALID